MAASSDQELGRFLDTLARVREAIAAAPEDIAPRPAPNTTHLRRS